MSETDTVTISPLAAADRGDESKQDRPWWFLTAGVFFAVVLLAAVKSRPLDDPEVYLHQIVAVVDVDVPGDNDRALEKINRLHAELLLPGKSFNVIAFRDGESLTSQGEKPGEMGWIGRGVLPPKMEDVAFSLAINAISEPIGDSHGYRILMVSDRRGFGGR